MTLTILSENGRGRLLSQWALDRGFQVNMVVAEEDPIQDLPFGELVKDIHADWMQDYINESKNVMKTGELDEGSAEKMLCSAWFDWNEKINLHKAPPIALWKREWNQELWVAQLEKMQRQGLQIRKEERLLDNEVTFDFRANLKSMPSWQWSAFDIHWDLGIYHDVLPSFFLHVQDPEQYFAYENLSFLQRGGGLWKVFLKMPYGSSADNKEAVIQAWLKNFKERWTWVKAEWAGGWQTLPFYQWKKDKGHLSAGLRSNHYEFGPQVSGSWSFEKQWNLEKKLFNALIQSVNQRKKKAYDFQILAP